MLFHLSFNHHILAEGIILQVPGTGDTKMNYKWSLPQAGDVLYIKRSVKVSAKPQARHPEHGEVEIIGL